MAVRRTDTEFGGRGGILPPAEFQEDAELLPHEVAMLQRMTEPTSTDDNEAAARSRLEKRSKRNDKVGR